MYSKYTVWLSDNIALATTVIVKKHYRSALVYTQILYKIMADAID